MCHWCDFLVYQPTAAMCPRVHQDGKDSTEPPGNERGFFMYQAHVKTPAVPGVFPVAVGKICRSTGNPNAE